MNKIKKTIQLFLLTSLVISSSLAASEGNEAKEEKMKQKLEKAKIKALSNIEKRIQNLQDKKNCISDAADRSSLKSCHEEAKSKNQAMREANKKRNKNKNK